MRQELHDRDVALAVRLEARQMRGHAVREAQRAAARTHTAHAVSTFVLEYSSHRVSSPAASAGVDPRVAEAPEQREPAVASHRDLGTQVAPLGDVAGEHLTEAFQR